MASISKRVSGAWQNTSYDIRATATDTITTLPTIIYADGTKATISIKGNTVQSGTPTPDNPIMPVGTGERTENVMPAGELKTVKSNGVTFSSDGKGKYSISGTATAYASVRFNLLSAFTAPVSVSNGGQGTLSFFNTQADDNVSFVFYNGVTKVDDWRQTPIRRTSTTYNAIGNKYVDNVVINVNSGATVDITITPEFTNDGVLPETFEKFGYKIPILSNSTTTPIYLGEVETTRKIKKLVLTGEETSWYISNDFMYNDAIQPDYLRSTATTLICSHYKAIGGVAGGGDVSNGQCALYRFTSVQRLYIRDNNFTSIADFKAYLAQQYAAGTPVCVWYVLANPETAVVNEPLMRIGDYADEVSGVSIPTTDGANTLSVDTTVQPSEVDINYHGWHMGTVHERASGQWD